MGLDRFANFISKSIHNDGTEDIYLRNNIRKIVASHVVFDLNFLMYQEIINIENEINDIIKIILCIPFALNKNDILEKLLKTIFTQDHWKPYYNVNEMESLFDGYNEDIIIDNFLRYINNKNNTTHSILELVIYEKIVHTIVENINIIHVINFIQYLLIFYDGMPSISKIIEQRRRRIKNHLESTQKKQLFKLYFDDLLPNNKKLFDCMSKNWLPDFNESKDSLLFDYFKWIKNRFSFDKSIGPASPFIKNLQAFMNVRLKKLLPKISIHINSATQNGESDLKIFKYISETFSYGDFCIHTTDSDLIHMILTQQTYYKIIGKDINLAVIKYLKNHNSDEYAQLLDANIIIKNILELYNNVNNTKTNNYKIIWDICLLFLFFGNDHLPSSIEIGPELGLEFFLKRHYIGLGKSNIVNLDKSNITLDTNNLLLVLEKIDETKNNNITKIILQRFFKINIILINVLVDKFNLYFTEILEFLKTFILYQTIKLSPLELETLNPHDLRRKLYDTLNTTELEQYKHISCFKFNDSKNKILTESIKLIEDNLDYFSHEYMGLIQYNKVLNITNDPYQDLYNYISDKTTLLLTKKYPQLYDHIDISDHLNLLKIDSHHKLNYDSNDYIKKIYHLVLIQFGYMKDFHTDNLTFYKFNNIPQISILITYLKGLKTNITKMWYQEITLDNVIPSQYLNVYSHHLLITPFIVNLPPHIKEMLTKNNLDTIDNMWFNDNDFEYRNIDIHKFLGIWNKTLLQINL